MTLTAFGRGADEALDECEAELGRLEKLFSATLPNSDAARIRTSAGGDIEVSADTVAMLETALRVSAQSGGAFDVTIYPLVDAWGFLTEVPHVPSEEEIADARMRVVTGALPCPAEACASSRAWAWTSAAWRRATRRIG